MADKKKSRTDQYLDSYHFSNKAGSRARAATLPCARSGHFQQSEFFLTTQQQLCEGMRIFSHWPQKTFQHRLSVSKFSFSPGPSGYSVLCAGPGTLLWVKRSSGLRGDGDCRAHKPFLL